MVLLQTQGLLLFRENLLLIAKRMFLSVSVLMHCRRRQKSVTLKFKYAFCYRVRKYEHPAY